MGELPSSVNSVSGAHSTVLNNQLSAVATHIRTAESNAFTVGGFDGINSLRSLKRTSVMRRSKAIRNPEITGRRSKSVRSFPREDKKTYPSFYGCGFDDHCTYWGLLHSWNFGHRSGWTWITHESFSLPFQKIVYFYSNLLLSYLALEINRLVFSSFYFNSGSLPVPYDNL